MITILFACALCSLFVALGVNSPNRQSIDQINNAQQVAPCARSPAVCACACCLADSSFFGCFHNPRLVLSGT